MRALESLSAERCVVNYLATYEADLFVYRNMSILPSKKAEFHERRRDRASRRLLASLRALTLLREKLALSEDRRDRVASSRLTRFGVASGSGRMASINGSGGRTVVLFARLQGRASP